MHLWDKGMSGWIVGVSSSTETGSRGCEPQRGACELKSGGDGKPLKVFEQERYSRATLQKIEDYSVGI